MKVPQTVLAGSMLFATLLLSQASAQAREVTIENPTVGGYGLDYCREWTRNCGLPAADAYCQERGYRYAVDFRWREDDQVTRVINGGQVCDAEFCDRITEVICKD